jgi:catechol 2,3-dioxygenase-like lactoylglutathione lyase family enzyme
MLHHISFGVVDIVRSARFYDAVLAALGYVRVWEHIEGNPQYFAVGYGSPGGGDKFALKLRPQGASAPGEGFHLAFAAPDRASVDRFFAAAIQHEGVDEGAPGLRPEYGPNYYAAYVVDPDGYRIEAVINSGEMNSPSP